MSTKTIVITGASRGIGAAIARAFAAKGWNIVIQGRSTEKLTAVARECTELGGNVASIELDLSETERVHEIVDLAIEKFGRLDVLVNNAGTMRPGGLEQQTSADFDFVMAVNCKAPVFLMKASIEHLKKTKGNLVNISSTSSFTPFQGILSYNMSKAALDHFTRTMATNLMTAGVKVNSINPATVRTDIHYSKGYDDAKVQEYYDHVTEKQPLGGVIEAEQIAEAVLMVTNEKLGSLTGQTIVIDGGRSQHPV